MTVHTANDMAKCQKSIMHAFVNAHQRAAQA